MGFDVSVFTTYWPLFLQGALLTIQVCLAAFVVGFALGTVLALLALVPLRPLRFLIGAYLAVLRGIPFIIILFLVHYGLPFAGVRLPAVFTGTIALSLFASAYFAEIVRAAIVALPKGQFESARAIGMSPGQAMRYVVAPQILRPLVPPSTNMTLTMIKESSVLSSITVAELTYQGLVVQGNTFAPFEVFAVVAGAYWLISIAVARAATLLERKAGGAQSKTVTRNSLADSFLSLERRPAS
jgi:His/Glu/Gln/Arg/opine family amino acid ABC transporter permease subunit